MAKSAVYGDAGGSAELSINMTPMIDVVFQLIIFFILASQFASKEISPLTPPAPHEPRAIKEEKIKERRVVVNVLSKEDPQYKKEGEEVLPGELAWYEIYRERIAGPNAFDEMRQIIQDHYEAAKKAERKDFHVEIRADWRVNYLHVARVMQAAGDAGVEKAYITVRESGRSKRGSR
jgi:biopolymer transport protein ExbD